MLVDPGTTKFADIVAAAAYGGVNVSNPSKVTVNQAAPSQASVIRGNDSYVISGGEVFTIS